jgi:branched-subunit amino acid permease
MSATISSALLAAACGFGATVWFLTAHYNRHTHGWYSVLYSVVAVSYLAIGVLLTARLIGRPFTPAPLASFVLLAVVFVIPPAVQLTGYLKARGLIDEQRAKNE